MSSVTNLPTKSLLKDAETYLIQNYVDADTCDRLHRQLLTELPWTNFPTAHRKHCNMGRAYQFSGYTFTDHPIHPQIQTIIDTINTEFNLEINSCYANLYGPTTTLGYHRDSEHQLDTSHPILSLSLNQPRTIAFKHNKTNKETRIELIDGDLLIMHTNTQELYQHAIIKPTTKQLERQDPESAYRISLTFRKFI